MPCPAAPPHLTISSGDEAPRDSWRGRRGGHSFERDDVGRSRDLPIPIGTGPAGTAAARSAGYPHPVRLVRPGRRIAGGPRAGRRQEPVQPQSPVHDDPAFLLAGPAVEPAVLRRPGAAPGPGDADLAAVRPMAGSSTHRLP